MKYKIFIYTLVVLILISPRSQAQTPINQFSRDLSLGDTGNDVKKLQMFLNQDDSTVISSSGPGSPGQETTYFGFKTKEAVSKFQEKYSNETLNPIGLSTGTGYVGQLTRNMLNKLISTLNTPVASSTFQMINQNQDLHQSIKNGVLSPSEAFIALSSSDLLIFGLSHTKVKVGDYVNISGLGFDSNTYINIGSNYSIKSASTSSNSLTIQIPNIPFGIYQIWANNNNGNTKNISPFYLNIGNITDSRPSISSVSPLYANKDDTITVTADKLDFIGNKIYSNLGIINSIPSLDKKKMSFRVIDLPNYEELSSNSNVNQIIVTFSIKTSEGNSLNYGYFILNK